MQVDFIDTLKANGAGFKNAFGIELENISSSQIESVTGAVLTEGYISVNANGTESNQDNAVIMMFDNARSMLGSRNTVSIKFKQPVTTTALGNAPFNPFIIIDANREKEVHLPTKSPTSLGNNIFEITGNGVNRDPDGDYLTTTGLPWAINVVHDFKVPRERISVNAAYNFFGQWASSGGTQFLDWYKDNPGHRNSNKLED